MKCSAETKNIIVTLGENPFSEKLIKTSEIETLVKIWAEAQKHALNFFFMYWTFNWFAVSLFQKGNAIFLRLFQMNKSFAVINMTIMACRFAVFVVIEFFRMFHIEGALENAVAAIKNAHYWLKRNTFTIYARAFTQNVASVLQKWQRDSAYMNVWLRMPSNHATQSYSMRKKSVRIMTKTQHRMICLNFTTFALVFSRFIWFFTFIRLTWVICVFDSN